VCELIGVFAAAVAVLLAVRPLVGEGPIKGALPAAAAILVQITLVWIGLRLRGQGWGHFGLRFGRVGARGAAGVLWRSIVTLVLAIVGFMLGAIVAANIYGMPEKADLSGYNPLAGNLPLLLVTLAGVYVTASFGEEMIYRGFLINRVEELVGGGANGARGRRGKAAIVAALIVSAVMFGLAHWTWGGTGMVQTGFMGLGLGVSYMLFGRNLWVTILAHGYMDTTLMMQMYLAG
jgi:hypothetical protein